MLSRVADAFYWMSRYLERAEHASRVVDVYLSLTLDGSTAGRTLLASVGPPPYGAAPRLRVVESVASGRLDTRYRDAVAGCIVASRENARNIREQVSSEMWEQLNRMYLLLREAEQEEVWADEPGAFVRAIVEGAHLFHGVTESTLSHDEGWHYIQIGRFIERATTTAAMLEIHFRDPGATAAASADTDAQAASEGGLSEYVEWVGLLRACGAFEAYCKHYTADLRPERIAEFLLLNAEFPRSVRFVIDRVEDSLRAVARALGKPSNGRPERFAGRLKATLNYGQIDEIMADSPLRYLENVRKQCEQVHAALYQTYITYSIEAAIAS
jgi:uncharacterized alpha-E superfamily protein